jgi:hypothetical protein
VTGLTGGRGCRDLLSRDAQPQITAATGAKCRDSRRTGISHDFRITRTAHSTTARKKERLATTEVLSSEAAYHLTLARGPYADIPAEFPQCLFTGC